MTHQPFKALKAAGTIRGFNRACASVESIRTPMFGKQGHRFTCHRCGTEKSYRPAYFHDTYGAAMSALNTHHCPTER